MNKCVKKFLVCLTLFLVGLVSDAYEAAAATFKINQEGAPCRMTIVSQHNEAPPAGGDATVQVSAPTGCSWKVTVDPKMLWIVINGDGTGTGNGSLSYRVNPNNTRKTRTGKIEFTTTPGRVTFNQKIHTVSQKAMSTVRKPTFSVRAGTYTGPLSIAITTETPAASTRYTTDGSVPTRNNGKIIGSGESLVLIGSSTLKAMAYLDGCNDSEVAIATYNLTNSRYRLTTGIEPQGSGSVVLTPAGGVYEAGTVVTLSASATGGYRFVGWRGADGAEAAGGSVIMNQDKTVSALFVKSQVPVASAGSDQAVAMNDLVRLNGGQSFDPDGSIVSYRWSFISRPVGSNVALSGADSSIPTFSPDLPGEYLVQLIVEDTDGALSLPAVVTVTATPPILAQNWSDAILLEKEEVKESEVAIDEMGNAFVVWSRAGSTWATRYSSSEKKWSPAEMIAPDHRTGTYTFSSDPHVAADHLGNAMVVWIDPAPIQWKVWGMRYSHDSGAWEAPILVETNPASGSSKNPRIVADSSGNFIAIWVQEDRSVWPFRNHIWANRYSVEMSRWGVPQIIDTTSSNSQYAGGYLQAATDGSGNIVVVWNELDGTVSNAWAASYSAGDGTWGVPALLKTNSMSGAYNLQVAMDGSGNAVAVWEEDDSNTGVTYSKRYVWMNRFVASTGKWGVSMMIPSIPSSGMFNPQVTLDGKGHASIVGSATSYSQYHLWEAKYSFIDDTISAPAYLSSSEAISSKIAADKYGNELCIFMVADGRSTVQSLSFDSKTASWQAAKQINGEKGWSGGYIRLATNKEGFAIMTWAQSDGLTYHLWGTVLK